MANPNQKPEPDQHYPDDDAPCPPKEPESPPAPSTDDCLCSELPEAPEAPEICAPKLPECPKRCNCPADPPATSTCFDSLIREQASQVKKAERAQECQKELEDLLKKATGARQRYTPDKYKEFKEKWKKQDGQIESLLGKLRCNLDCWDCVIECEICPLLYAIRDLELNLEGDERLIAPVYSLRDLRHWHDRNRYQRGLVFERIKGILAAWEDPAKTIEAHLGDNQKLIETITNTTLGSDPAEALVQVFVTLIPMHLAIAPRDENGNFNTKIRGEYWKICCCAPGEPEICSSLDVGVPSALQQLTGPQPYIVNPDRYFKILCCIATHRYLPAKNQLAEAEAGLADTDARIAKADSDLKAKRSKAAVIGAYRENISRPIDCKQYQPKDGDDCGCDDADDADQNGDLPTAS